MASTMGFSLLFALFLVTAVAARQDPFGEEKTYAPPYGSDSPPSGSSPVVPSPDPVYSPPAYSPSDPSPTTPSYSPPYTPSDPSPTTPSYTPPYTPDPATPAPSSPGTCKWWSSNTSSFPSGIITMLSTILDLFGGLAGGGSSGSGGSGVITAITSIFGGQMTVMQGLTNTRNDGFGALAREGSAALLNSLTRRDYPMNAFQVKTQFRNALHSQQQAFTTARLFENANVALGAGRH